MFVTISHPHKCTCVSKAPAMGQGREWFIGKLDQILPDYPEETHCLHLKTNYKDVTFLCNEADFRNLMIICRAVVGQPNEAWMEQMVQASLSLPASAPKKKVVAESKKNKIDKSLQTLIKVEKNTMSVANHMDYFDSIESIKMFIRNKYKGDGRLVIHITQENGYLNTIGLNTK